MDNVISTRNVQVESKYFTIEYRENDRGLFLRIIEEAHGRRNIIIVPSPGLADFTAAVTDVLTTAQKLTPE